MNFLPSVHKAKAPIWLFIVPILLILFSLMILFESSAFFYSWYDPTYAYLFNGLTFALGSADIGHVDLSLIHI